MSFSSQRIGVQNEAGKRLTVLSRERTGHSKHPFPRDNYTHGRHHTVNTEIRFIIFFAVKNGAALYSQQKQDRDLTVAQIIIAKYRLKLKKVGKTTRPLRYDLNQTFYDYTVKVTN